MSEPTFQFPSPLPLVVGSFGDYASLVASSPESLALECDLAEVRLDLIYQEYLQKGPEIWAHLKGFPLLFTARRHSEGSPLDLDTSVRKSLIESALPAAFLVDIEVASIAEMSDLVGEMNALKLPWVASFHNFDRLPTLEELSPKATLAKQAGAAAFKFAARLHSEEDLPILAHLQCNDFGLPVASMGMGELAPVSRLLCAKNGSCLNYGFIGKNETAPGQWPAKRLREGIRAEAATINRP